MKLIHEDASAQSVEFLRQAIFGFWLILMATDPFYQLSELPVSLFNPTGFLIKFLPSELYPFLLSQSFLITFKVVLVAALLCVVCKWNVKGMGVIACLCLTWHQGLVRSFGHMNHTELNLLYAAYIVIVYYSTEDTLKRTGEIRKTFNPYSVPFIFIISVICLHYMFIGSHRLIAGGIKVYTSDTLPIWIVMSSNMARSFSWHLEDLIINYPWFKECLKIGFVFGTLFEILAPLCLISRRFRHVFLLWIIPFHIFIWLFMGILFLEQMFLLLLFFDIGARLKPIVWPKGKGPILKVS